MNRNKHLHPAFTIVELLIVIVIIAILATITIVAYNGITNRAHEASLKSDLTNGSNLLGISKTINGTYPSDLTTANNGQPFKSSGDNTPVYNTDATQDAYCLEMHYPTTNPTMSFFVTDTNTSPQQGTCSGVTGVIGGVPAGGGGATPTLQAFTSSDCSALTTYTGSNSAALITLQDTRGTPQSYTIGKLADNHCWMLDNLKLGSTSSTLTLTPSDSNVASNFTLPQVTAATSGANYDTPTASGPVPGDTGTGDANYGYLYNWPAATAGESRTSKPAGSSAATNSICPKNWHLPSGNATGEFVWLNAKMNNPSASSPSTASGSGYYQNWNYTGPFRGVLAGSWWNNGFDNQSSGGYLWSSSPDSGGDGAAFDLFFYSSIVYSGYVSNRFNGFGVRCLLN